MQDKDKFGFYTVGDLKFYSKFDAADLAAQTNQSIQWHFNDDVFGLYDWTKEPVASLTDLYRTRAQQLRDNYDYLVLWYSGGADCDNILDTFVDNNIRLDEAAGVINMAADSDKNGYLNGEIYNLTVPKIQQICETSQPWLIHTLLDLCQPTVDYFSNTANRFDWVHKVSHYVNPNYMARSQIVKTQRHWMDMIDSGKRVAFIWGIDKPKIVGINNEFSLMFRDVQDAAPITHHQVDATTGLFDEMFYWTPDLPELIIKQAHVLKKYMKTLPATSPLLTTKRLERQPVIAINGQLHWLKYDGIHTALYPKWHSRPFQVKPESLIFSPRDQWFFNLPDNDIAKQTWRQGLEYRWNNTPDFLKTDATRIDCGFKVLTSRPYNIGP
jgi:hypothetical protein